MTIGSINAQGLSLTPSSNARPKNSGSATRKLTRLERMMEMGSTSRGKKTFLIRWALPTTLAVPPMIEAEKKFQGSKHDKMKAGKAGLSLCLSMTVETNVKTSIISSGFNSDQATPRAEFL